MRIELDFGKFAKSYEVIGKQDNKYFISERSPAVLDAMSRNPNPSIRVISEAGVLTGIGHVGINTIPVEVTAVTTAKKEPKTGKNTASSTDDDK